MKRFLSFLFVLMLLVSNAAYAEQSFTVEPNPPKGYDYSYKYNAILFKAGASQAVMDKYLFDLTAAPLETDGDLYVALDDLEAMYAPDFKVTVSDGHYTVEHVGLTAVLNAGSAEAVVDDNAYTFKNMPKIEDGVLFVPVMETMKVCFAKETATYRNPTGDYYAVSYTHDKAIDKSISRGLDAIDERLSGKKKCGFQYLTYTIADDPDQKVLPLRMYVPTSYDPAVPNKAILLIHGNSRNQDFFFTDTNSAIAQYREIEDFAEQQGYILISATAYIVNGTYGNVNAYPNANSSVIEELSEEDIALRILSEKSAMSGLELAKSLFNIDPDHLYLLGQSMGGTGSLILGNNYPGMFKAIASTGGTYNFLMMEENPFPNLENQPIFFVLGTEDERGFVCKSESFLKFMTWVNESQYYWVGGGDHSTAWAQALDKIFEYFEAQQ